MENNPKSKFRAFVEKHPTLWNIFFSATVSLIINLAIIYFVR